MEGGVEDVTAQNRNLERMQVPGVRDRSDVEGESGNTAGERVAWVGRMLHDMAATEALLHVDCLKGPREDHRNVDVG